MSLSRTAIFFLVSVSLPPLRAAPPPADCNLNGLDDTEEIRAGSPDCNFNGMPDECDLRPTLILEAGTNYPIGPEPRKVLSRDLDQDGQQDLALASGRDGLLVYFNRGGGSLEAPLALSPGVGMHYVACADLDGDDRADLVALALNSPLIFVVLNSGRRSFRTSQQLLLDQAPDGQTAIKILCTDLDGDSDADLATSVEVTAYPNEPPIDSEPVFSGKLALFLNDGHGNFPGPMSLEIGQAPRFLASADLDGDGDADLALAQPFKVQVLLNQGSGTQYRESKLPIGSDPVIAAAADLDGDSAVDLITANSLNVSSIPDNISVLFNNSDGTFEPAINLAVGKGPSDLSVSDLDRDGSPDLAVACKQTNSVSVILNDGKGRLRAEAPLEDILSPQSVAAADLDGNGDLDLILTSDMGVEGIPTTLQVLWGKGGASYAHPGHLSVGKSPASIRAVDLDGDGDEDLAVGAFGAGQTSVLLNDGQGLFKAKGIFGPLSSSFWLGSADLDGDEDPDLLSASGEVLSVLWNNGEGAFEDWVVVPTGQQYARGAAAADLNGDGMPDLISASFSSFSNSVATIPNLGNGSFGAAVIFPAAQTPWDMVAVDLDLDGEADAVAENFPGSLTVFWNSGKGRLDRQQFLTAGKQPIALDFGDLDGDGDPDLVAANQISDDISVFINNGDRSFAGAVSYPVEGIGYVKTADVDGDGHLDLATANQRAGDASVLLNDGTGRFRTQIRIAAGSSTRALAAGDFDGDGRLDLAFTNIMTDTVSLVLNRSLPAVSKDEDQDGVPDACEAGAFHRGDPNNDGTMNFSDGIAIFAFLFLDGKRPTCMESADSNSDGNVDISDGAFLLNFLFLGGLAPAAPGPPPAPCGLSPPGSSGKLGCKGYDHCR